MSNAIFDMMKVRNPFGSGEEWIGMSLKCEDDLNMSLSKPLQVITSEKFSSSPLLVVTFIDGNGDLMNAKKLDSAASYELILESYDGSRVVSEWNLSHISHKNNILGQSQQGMFSLNFVHKTWKDFSYKTHCRGWGQTRYSEVVSQIASECGFDVTDIAPTKDTIETIQQPNWTNAKLLTWIMSRAYPTNGSGQFEYSLSIDGKFVFAPLSDFIKQEFRLRGNIKGVPRIYLHGLPENSKQTHSRIKSNDDVVFYATNYSVVEDSGDNHKQGAGGVSNSWYDFDSGKYKRENVLYSDTSNLQLSEWSLVNNGYEDSPLQMTHGRNDIEAGRIAENRVVSVVNAMQKVRVLMPTSTVLKVGEVVELYIPNPREHRDQQGMYNEIHSGKYVVSSVTNHMNNRRSPTFTTELLLVRQGVDKKESEYNTKSKRGKA